MTQIKIFSQILRVCLKTNTKGFNPTQCHIWGTRKLNNRINLNYSTSVRLFSSTTMSATKRALVVISNGSEEIESVTPIDVLRRANVEVTVAGLQSKENVICSRNVILGPEVSFAEALTKGTYDAIILPGGLGGAKCFSESKELGDFLKEQEKSGRLVAAICAAPTALKAHGIGNGKSITSYPSVKDQMTDGGNYIYSEDRVVIDGNLITSRGPGTAMEFSLALVEYLVGKEKSEEVAKGLLFIK